MLKIFIAFVIFAAISLYVISLGGDNVDMGGEKHGVDTSHSAPAPAAAPAAAPANEAQPAAPAAPEKK